MKHFLIETDRLYLREYTYEDFEAIYEIVSDPETMKHYPSPYNEKQARLWVEWSMRNYKEYGFGWWVVILKETGQFIGDCGLTMQNINGDILPEIGYHFHKKHWKKGYGSEAARAVKDWAFEHTEFDCLYSYMTAGNIASYKTAEANGMKRAGQFHDEKYGEMYLYKITRDEWRKKA